MNFSEKKPDISIIVPVYNVEEYLGECLDSLQNQGNISCEVIIVDDGSTDSSGEIADEYAEKYDNYHVHHIENAGLGHARNFGVKSAKGKYLFFVDSDDIVVENTLEKMFTIAEINASDMTICNVARFNSKKVWSSNLHKKVMGGMKYCTHIYDNPELIYDTTSWNKLINREFYMRNGFRFPENILYEDIPVTIPMHILANNVSVYNEVGYLWRVRDGATKSITQNTSNLKNLYDRLTALQMIDKFFEENVENESLILEKQKKALVIDLNIFVNACVDADSETALKIMKAINEYIDRSVSQEAIDSVSMIAQQKYLCVKRLDQDALRKVCEYEKTKYYDAITKIEGDRLIVDLDNDIFDSDNRDLTSEFRDYPVRMLVDSLESVKSSFIIHAHIYKRRISIPNHNMMKFKAHLFNVVTGERTELEVEGEEIEHLTKNVGFTIDEETGNSESMYNYNGIGFKVIIDLNKIMGAGLEEGRYKIEVEYENEFYSGVTLLNGASKFAFKKKESCVTTENALLRLGFHYLNELFFDLDKGVIFYDSIEKENNDIIYCLKNDIDSVYASDAEDNRIPLEKIDGNRFRVKTDKFEKEKEYFLYAVSDDGKTTSIVSSRKKISIIELENKYAVHTSLKTRITALYFENVVSKVTDAEQQGDICIINTKASSFSADKIRECDAAEIVIHDEIAGKDVVIAKGKCKLTSNGNVTCKHKIDFSKERITKNFYAGCRNLLIKYYKDGEVVTERMIYCDKDCNMTFDFETLKIKMLRQRVGALCLEISQKWLPDENSPRKRKAIKQIKYPMFCKEPINPRQIVFESMWGTKYSCNVQALYEYIDKNYPEYECIWFFEDPRTPIKGNGKRVRRGSEEYWHYLATAKYFVNNVNFETAYVKRKGQVHIQTMHGTPLKTLGLDVKADFPTEKSVEQYIEKCKRWDYLIVQGKFMKGKAKRCFKFNKKILKTGYPRTDSLYKKSEKKILKIKEDLGIPTDKKIILYAPTWRVKNKFDMMLDIEKMKSHISDDYILLVRLHHLCSSGYTIPEDGEFVFNLNNYRYVDDLYLISDILITDYSSVMFDYALLNKPMLFFTYDLEQYCDDLRGLYVDFKNEAPGPILYTSDEVVEAIENIDDVMKKCAPKIKAFKKKYLTYEDNLSSANVVKKVLKPQKRK